MRKKLGQALLWLAVVLSAGVSGVIVSRFLSKSMAVFLETRIGWGKTDDLPDQWMYGIGIAFGVMVLLGYLLTLDSHARRRPTATIGISAFAAGFAPGFAWAAGYIYQEISAATIGIAFGWGAGMVAVVLGFEYLNRWLWPSVMRRLDANNLGGAALLVSRLALLWSPGQDGLLKSVSLERFRRGARGEVADLLRQYHRDGDRSPALLELLCQLATEEQKPHEFLGYLRDLLRAFPDNKQLQTAMVEELLAQGHPEEALEHMGRYGVDENEEALERYATLLVDHGRLERAVDVARKLGELEGIPMRRSDTILRKALAKNDTLIDAVNLLVDHAERMARKDQQIRWLERSVALNRRQPQRVHRLLALYEEAEMTRKLEDLVAELAADAPGDFGLGLRYARILFGNGKVPDAVEVLERLHARGCNQPELLVQLAIGQFESGRRDEARKSAEAALARQLSAEQEGEMRQLLRKIERAQFTDDLASMIESSEQQPENLDLQLQTLHRLSLSGHSDRAVAVADRTLRHHPTARERVIRMIEESVAEVKDGAFPLLSYLADLQVAEGRFDDALETVKHMSARSLNPAAALRDGAQKILRRSPHHLKTLATTGEMYQRMGQFTEMIHAYSLYLANGGEETEAMDRALAQAYMSLNDYTSARRFAMSLLNTADDSNKEDTRALLEKIIPMAIESGNAIDAAEFQKRLELVAPNQKETRKLATRVKESLGKERFSFLQREIDSGKGDIKILEELGDICMAREDYNQAITYFQRAARQPGSTRIPAVKLAYCFAKKRMYDLAGETLGDLRLSLNDDPAELEEVMGWLYDTGTVLEESHLFERAAKLFKQLMKIDAGYRDVLQRVEKLGRL